MTTGQSKTLAVAAVSGCLYGWARKKPTSSTTSPNRLTSLLFQPLCLPFGSGNPLLVITVVSYLVSFILLSCQSPALRTVSYLDKLLTLVIEMHTFLECFLRPLQASGGIFIQNSSRLVYNHFYAFVEGMLNLVPFRRN